MKEHKQKKHRRASHDRDSPELARKLPKREPRSRSPSPARDEEDRQRRKHHHHHDRHHRPTEGSRKESAHHREDRDPERNREDRDRNREDRDRNREVRDRERRRDDHDRDRRPSDHIKIKEEPMDSDDGRQRRAAASKWDEEEDGRNERRNNRDPERGGGRDFHNENSEGRRGFRGGGGRGGRGGRGRGGRGGGPGRSRFFPKGDEDTSNMEWGKKTDNEGNKALPPEDRDKPNFGLSGKLTEDKNTYKGVVIKYSEPPEARVPKRRWRLYPFKGEEALKVLYIHRASAFLMGRERKVVDIPLDHPSCSKQHAAIQFRLVQYTRLDGAEGKRIRPYIIDLESANGTFVNNNKIEPKKYVELLERDVLKFGYSSREYVLLHEHSKDEEEDDNHQ